MRTPRGRLTVSAPVLFGALHVTPAVTEFLQRHPAVRASCWFLDQVVNLTHEGVDMAVRIGERPDSSQQANRVGSARRVTVAPSATWQSTVSRDSRKTCAATR